MKIILPFLAAFILLTSCAKEATDAPVNTDSSTFSTKVNGVLWMPKGFGIAPTAPILEAHYKYDQRRGFVIQARNFAHEPKESEFEIYLEGVKTPGTYLLNGQASYAYYEERMISPLGAWKTDGNNSGTVTITLVDTVKHIYEGTFNFQASNMDGGTPLSVADGRFKVKVR